MISLSGNAKIFLYQTPVDLRKGFEGLSAIVEIAFHGELTTGAYFIFLNKPRNRMKVLYWDSDGLAIWYKRLERGTFSKGNLKDGKIERTKVRISRKFKDKKGDNLLID